MTNESNATRLANWQMSPDNPTFRNLLLAAKYLLLAAKGPKDGPTNWDETRQRWLQHTDSLLKESENESQKE